MNFVRDIITQAIDFKLYDIHTHLPGRIESYDHTKKKASVQPLIKKRLADGTDQSMPLLVNVPVILPFKNDIGLSYPINEGDYCLILFSERSLDRWLTFGGEVNNPDPRIFDLSDAFAIAGLMPFSESSTIPNNKDVYLKNKQITVKLQDNGKVAIGTQTNELLDIVSQLLGLLAGTIVPQSPGPAPAPLIVKAQLQALQLKIDTIKGTLP